MQTEFFNTNHIFFIIEVFRAYFICDYILSFLGCATTYLSVERHRHLYTKYNYLEPIVAKSTIMYITIRGLYQFTLSQKIYLLATEAMSIFIWCIQKYDYETIHPWLHITVAFNIHLYIEYCRINIVDHI